MLPAYKSVLFATDLGPSAPAVLRPALGLARAFGGTVAVVHVLESLGEAARHVVDLYAGGGDRGAAAAPAPARPSPELEAARQRLAAAEILFEYDRARLTPEGERALKLVAADLVQFPGITFTVEGHADDRGAATYNKALGLRRAEVVMRYLVKAGVAFERMKLTSQGELRPKVPKKDAQSRALNRRVNLLPLP